MFKWRMILKQRTMIKMTGLVLMMVGSLMLVDSTSAVNTSITVTSSGSQSIDVIPAAGTAISSDAINVTTTCRYGYNFDIQTSVEDNALYLNGDLENYENTIFWPAGGLDPLNETENEWGYFYDGDTVPTSASIFSSVPSLFEDPAIVKTSLDTPASSDINDNFNIYYGVSVAPDADVGTYKMIPDEHGNDGTIVYIATVAGECSRYTVQFSPTSIFECNTLSGTGTMDNQAMYEDITDSIASNSYTAPNGYYFAGWNTAQDGSGTSYYNQQSVTNLTTAGNTVTLYAMWTDCPPNTVCYSSNISNPNDVEGEMGDQIISSSDTSVTLYAPNFKRGSYGFAAWNTNQSGTGTNFGPQATIEFAAGAYDTGGIKLYAKWIASAGNMQNWSGCSNMNTGDVTALKDTRDNNVYAVAKLADDKCWMIENLRLADKDANNNDVILSSANTHNPSLPLNNTWYYKNQQGTLTTSNHLSTPSNPYSTNPDTAWCWESSSDCANQSMLATNNTVFFIDNTSSSYDASGDIYSYGNYYNWYSATAGHGKYGSSYGIGYHAPGDICPAGWHLPTGGHSTVLDFALLDIALGGTGDNPEDDDTTLKEMSMMYRSYPNNIVYSGFVYYSSSIDGRNESGHYLSASGNGWEVNYGLDVMHANYLPGTHSQWKYGGWSVRCIAGT